MSAQRGGASAPFCDVPRASISIDHAADHSFNLACVLAARSASRASKAGRSSHSNARPIRVRIRRLPWWDNALKGEYRANAER